MLTPERDRDDVATQGLDPARVCTLSADGLSARLDWIRREILPHVRRTEERPSGFAWELEMAPGLAEKLDRLVALERECCEGIVFARAQASAPGRLGLEVHGLDPRAEVYRALRVDPASGRGDWARLAKSGGLGVSLALLVCCALPLLGAALAGGLAAPLASLDSPWAIALASLASSAAAWRWQGRDSSGSVARGDDAGGCGSRCG